MKTIKTFFKNLIQVLTFTNLPIRKKFILFSAGTLFWIVAASIIGLISLLYLNLQSGELVNYIEPYQKLLNSSIRKISRANISAHKLLLSNKHEDIHINSETGKNLLEECYTNLSILKKGGFIKEYSEEESNLIYEFYVKPVTDSEKKKLIDDIINNLKKLKILFIDIANAKNNDLKNLSLLKLKISEYDVLTQKSLHMLDAYIIDLSREGNFNSNAIKKGVRISFFLIILTMFIGATLSIVFGILISINLVRPINSIAANFRAFTTKMDFAKEITINSSDELGILAQEYNKFIEELEGLTNFKKLIEEDETVEDVYKRLGEIITLNFGFAKCIIYEISTYKNKLKTVFPENIDISELNCKVDIVLNCDLCRAKRTGHIISSEEKSDICKYANVKPDEIYLCHPIFISGKVGGIVQIVIGKSEAVTSEVKQRILKARQYISEAQPVLEAKRVMRAFRETSIKDGLTDIYNRRFLEETSENLVAGIQRRNTTLGFLMCDLDFFKEVNDKYGHDNGDKVLKITADIIKKSVRSSDLVIRFGGEEFLVLLIDIQPEKSIEIAKKIKSNMENTKISIAGATITKTISIGVSEIPKDTQSFWEAIKFADVALYKAKETGRNKVVRFTPEMWTEDRY